MDDNEDKPYRLSLKEERFCQYYIIDGNSTQAAIKAGYSEKSAASIGNYTLKKAKIDRRIKELRADSLARMQVTADKVVREVSRIAFLNVKEYFDEDGSLIPIDMLPDDFAAAIQSLDIEEKHNSKGAIVSRIKKVRFHPKMDALKMLAEQLGLSSEKAESTHIQNVLLSIQNYAKDMVERASPGEFDFDKLERELKNERIEHHDSDSKE